MVRHSYSQRAAPSSSRARLSRFPASLQVSSLGTGKFGWPASVLNLFWNVLEHKRDAELALVASGMPFTIVRPGGMERPTDDYADTHGTVLHGEDTRFGGQVSRLQVAQLCAECVASPSAAANKIVEVVAEEGVPLRPLERQLDALPRAVVGMPTQPGSAEAYTAKYKYQRGGMTQMLDIMAFGYALRHAWRCAVRCSNRPHNSDARVHRPAAVPHLSLSTAASRW